MYWMLYPSQYQTLGCFLLDVSAEQSTNRSEYTFAGAPDAVVFGAFNSARVAHQLIDMSKHEGRLCSVNLPTNTSSSEDANPNFAHKYSEAIFKPGTRVAHV